MPRGVTLYQRDAKNLTAENAAAFLHVSTAQFEQFMRAADFPRPTVMNGVPRWFANELEDWRAAQLFKNRFRSQ